MGLHRRFAVSLPFCAALVACPGDPATTTVTTEDTGAASSSTGATAPTTAGEEPTAGTTGSSTGATGQSTSTITATSTDTSPDTSPGTSTDTSTGATDTTTGGGSEGGLTQRPAEPIVLVGGQVPGLGTVAAVDVVGFAWRDGAWVQLPVQVDERVRADFCTIYAKALLGDMAPCKTAKKIEALFYADPKTYTGADTDPKVDLDDELVFMARDAGDRVAPGTAPRGVVAGSGVEVEVVDGGETGWVYLFERAKDGGLTPDAGVDLVSYALVFDGDIDYLTQYPFIGKGSCGDKACDPPILEDSVITSPHYERHFSARWVTDSLRITTPGSTGEDILDIAQARFAPGYCGRHVLTFSTSEGAFIANIDGPVRAIRSYMGANSGPLTQRTHLFYDRVEVVQTFLRVHAIPAIMDLVDYSSDAPGMTYYNDHNEAGLAIDGVADPAFDTTQFTWEVVSGPHGSVVSVIEPRISKDLTTIGYWEDNAGDPTAQCSESNVLDHPDEKAFGTSGMWITAAIPDTDPRSGALDYLFIARTSFYEEPGLDLAAGKAVVALAQNPPTVSARSFTDAPGDVCGDGMCGAGEAATCPFDCNPIDGSCGDQLCDLWENSVNCAGDCSSGGGSKCGDDKCDVGEHELSCATDCWSPGYEPLSACLNANCPMQSGACSDELPCVDRVVCTAECVAGGGVLATCQTNCNMQIPATMEQANFANALLLCGSNACA